MLSLSLPFYHDVPFYSMMNVVYALNHQKLHKLSLLKKICSTAFSEKRTSSIALPWMFDTTVLVFLDCFPHGIVNIFVKKD